MRSRWTVQRRIEAHPDVVWELLARPERWPEWGPTVRSATGPEVLAAGSTGTVTPIIGPPLAYRVTEFEAGRRWDWTVAGITATGHEIRPIVEVGDRLVTDLVFTAPSWAFFYTPVLRLAARRLDEVAMSETTAC